MGEPIGRGAGRAAVRARHRRRWSSPRRRICGRARSARSSTSEANTLDVTATIVDLAVRKYLVIEEIPKEGWFGKPDWKLITAGQGRRRPAAVRADACSTGCSRTGTRSRSPACEAPSHERLAKVEDALYATPSRGSGSVQRPDKVRASWHARIGALLLVAGIVLTFVLARWTHAGLLGIPLVIGGLLLTFGRRWMPSRTAKGTAMPRRVRGFRTRDRDRGDAHGAVGRGGERLHAVPAVRDRVRLHRQVGEGVRGARRRCRPTRRWYRRPGRSSSRSSRDAMDASR